METKVIPFEYKEHEVRVIQDEDGEFWFVAKDVCDIVGIEDVSQAVEKVDDDEKLIRKIYVSGQDRDVWTVSESGLYTLIIRSNKEAARPFRRWVTHEVLPAIRKTGRYAMPGVERDAGAQGEVEPFGEEAMERLRTGADKLVCVARAFDASYRVYRRIGSMNRRQKIVAANRLTREETGVDCLAIAHIHEYVPNWDFKELADKRGMTLMGDLMGCMIPVNGNGDNGEDDCFTVAEIISDDSMYVKYNGLLQHYGLKKTNRGVFFHPGTIEERLLPDARHDWSKTPVRDTLLQAPGAQVIQLRLNGSPVRGVVIPTVAMPVAEGGAA